MSSTLSSDLHLSSMGDLTDYVALVTGGGTGLGLLMARALAINGAKVYITGRTTDKIDHAAKEFNNNSGNGSGQMFPYNANGTTLAMDVTSKPSIQEARNAVEKRFGKLDVLINNAGTVGDESPFNAPPATDPKTKPVDLGNALFEHHSDDSWSKIYNTNTVGPFLVTNAFLALLSAGAESRAPVGEMSSVINISSACASVRIAQNLYAYKCSKSALNILTQSLATEYSFNQIPVRVNAISPGLFPSEMTRLPEELSGIAREKLPGTCNPIPIKRPDREEEIGIIACWLVGKGGGYVNGQVIAVDGGFETVNP